MALIATGAIAAIPGGPTAQASSTVTVAIDSVTPQVALSNSTVVVTGTVSNRTSAPLTGFNVQLLSSQTWFGTRSDMDSYAAGGGNPPTTAEGSPVLVASTVRPGGTATWRAEFSAANASFPQFGVYPLQAYVTDTAGTLVATGRTLLPYWPSNTAGIAKLKIAWVWPLIDQPHRQVCPALTSDSLAQPLAAGGRLNTLLTAGADYPQADLTWVIDPALLADASTMTGKYLLGGKPTNCTQATAAPASLAASTWLDKLKTVTSSQPAVITPYANVDVAALVHRGFDPDLKAAYQLGEATAQRVMRRTFSPDLAVPAGGLADQSVLTTLATSEHVTGVVLSSSEMPPADPKVFTEDAVSSIPTGAGTRMSVLLADDTLTSLLRNASASMSAGAQFALEQRFLAETAMIASESPGTPRSVVVSPPETWGPSLALAQSLLRETSAPWLRPATLTSLAGSHDPQSQLKRKLPPASKVSPRELSGAYMSGVGNLDDQVALYTSVLYQPLTSYTTGLDEALAATESAAWRGSAASRAQGQALVNGLIGYLNHAMSRVRIITTTEITMAGASGMLPVPIQNGLEQQNVQVTLVATPIIGNSGKPLTISGTGPIIIDAGQTKVEKIHVSGAPNGSTVIQLKLTSTAGQDLPQQKAALTVHSTRYGQAILILIAAAIGLLVLSSLFRAGRRWSAAPGNVMTGDRDLTEAEAPDDLADARRRADDT